MERIEDSRDYWDHRALTFALDTDQETREKGDRIWEDLFRDLLPEKQASLMMAAARAFSL